MKQISVLIVDDDMMTRQTLSMALADDYVTFTAKDGENALAVLAEEDIDIVLSDLDMPGINGIDLLERINASDNPTPVIIITAREEETDAVLGLELGADDYVIKPFRMRELVSRIKATLRRTEGAGGPSRTLQAGEIVLDESMHSVEVRGKPVRLTPMEFGLLALLMAAPGQVFTREKIVERLSEKGFAGLERTLNVHVRNLRTKIESDPEQPEYIETVFGVGYRFRPEA